jgi:hypothetical protein
MINTIHKTPRQFKLVFLVCLFLLNSSCARFQANEYENSFLFANKKVILEVSTKAGETSYPQGQILDMRLYNDMEVEFDFYLPNTPERVGLKFTSEMKKGELTLEAFDQILSLLGKPDLLSASNYYKPSRSMSVDSSVKKIVNISYAGNEKQIVLEENDSHLHLKEKSIIYPESLLKLLELTEKTNKELRRQIDPESR